MLAQENEARSHPGKSLDVKSRIITSDQGDDTSPPFPEVVVEVGLPKFQRESKLLSGSSMGFLKADDIGCLGEGA